MLTTAHHRETIAALEAQLEATQEMLTLQQIESQTAAEHTILLNGEIDVLRKKVQEQTTLLTQLQGELQEKHFLIIEQQQTINSNNLTHAAFYTLEQQNLILLKKVKEQEEQILCLETEIRFLEAHRQDSMLIAEKQLKRLNELEITGPFHQTKLSNQLEQAEKMKEELSQQVRVLQAENASLRRELIWHDSVKADQLARAKSVEFKQLIELDSLDRSIRRLEVDSEELSKANVKERQRGGELQAQLVQSVERTNRVQEVCGAVIDLIEQDEQALYRREKEILRMNTTLQEEKQMLQKVVHQASRQVQKLKTMSLPLTSAASASASSLDRLSTPKKNKKMSLLTSKSSQSDRASVLPELSVRSPQGQKEKNSLVKTAPAKVSRQLVSISSPPLAVQSTSRTLPTLNREDSSTNNREEVERENEEEEEVDLKRTVQSLSTDLPFLCVNKVFSLYLSLVSLHMRLEENGVRDDTLQRLSLSSLELGDRHSSKIIEWLRRVPLQYLQSIELDSNYFSLKGLADLAAWVLALGYSDIIRCHQPLTIDLRHNRIKAEDMTSVMDLLSTRSDFALVRLQNATDRTIVIYGRSNPDDEVSPMQLLVSIDLNNQRGYKKQQSQQTASISSPLPLPLPGRSDVMGNMGIIDPVTSLSSDMDPYDKIYPRNAILDIPIYS
eukprot:gene5245-5776_t